MVKYIQHLFPNIVANKVYKYMSQPKVRSLRDSEEKVMSLAKTEVVTYKNFLLMRYEWGNQKNKTVFLVHGWEGQTGNFASLIPILLKANYKIVSFDAPSHGKSSIGKTNMFEFSNMLTLEFKKEMPELVISHSFGSVNVARVLKLYPEIDVKLWLLVTTPNNFKSRIKEIAFKFDLNNAVIKKVSTKIEADVNENINDLNMITYCSQLNNVEKALIVHSVTDKVLPVEGAREVNQSFTQSKMIELNNYGHYSILWSKELQLVLTQELENLN
ncbi:alpha/beta hydrolase [Pontimicrobium aquaticum]|uniref:Alpha/beta hydrolase n=1 Tax=Pontimicrobium aquaticum TaxID=2565367 RepID=A0A4U0EVN9_9FLAO|nr:alpha/beta hydrolase [Pontimicrobium aquaticum]TJY35923.1 alpha/beta hydrolase [Pontimicrobium aquaticum]